MMARHILVRAMPPSMLIAVLVFAILWSRGAHAPARAGNMSQTAGGRIEAMGRIRVIDGDTIEAYVDGARTDIGLIGIRAPMGNTSCGRAAAETLRTLVADGLFLEEDPDIVFDDHGRHMYYTTTADGRSIPLELVRAGIVWADGQGRDAEQLAAAQAEAEANRIGCLFG